MLLLALMLLLLPVFTLESFFEEVEDEQVFREEPAEY